LPVPCMRNTTRRRRQFRPPTGEMNEMATIPDFSLTTLTTTGYGDIVPIDPFARSLANLESVLGQFYLAVTVARLVTLELAGRRR
jgi:Ion channel